MAVLGPIRDFMKRYAIGQAFGVGFMAFDYAGRRRQGQGVMQAAGGAAVSNAAFIIWPEFAMAQAAAQLVPMGASAILNGSKNREFRLQTMSNRGFIGGGYQDTQANATMRQAGMQSIASSYANVQTAFGNEARMYS